MYKLRPSAAATWVHCHGMPKMTAGMSEDDDTDVTVREEGTAAHWVAHELSKGVAVAEGSSAPNGVEVDSDMLESVGMYLDTVAKWNAPAFFEQPVHCAEVHEECGGTLDVCAFDWDTFTLYLADFKYGYGYVDVMGNWQLLCYFTGARKFYGLTGQDFNVVFTIVQPRGYHTGGFVRTWKVRASDLDGYIETLRVAAVKALGPSPECVASPRCTNCAARGNCNAAQNSAYIALDMAHAATPHKLPFQAAEDELRRLEWANNILSARITGLTEQVIHGIKRGELSRNYGLQPTAGRLAWLPGTEGTVQNLGHLYDVQLVKEPKLITPTQAQKLLPESVVSKYSSRTPGASKLVPSESLIFKRIFGDK